MRNVVVLSVNGLAKFLCGPYVYCNGVRQALFALFASVFAIDRARLVLGIFRIYAL
jgi:hypothetical protein